MEEPVVNSQASHTLPPSQPAVRDKPALRAETDQPVVNSQASHTLPPSQPAVRDSPALRAETEEAVVNSQALHDHLSLQQSSGKRHVSRLETQTPSLHPQAAPLHSPSNLAAVLGNTAMPQMHTLLQPTAKPTDQHALGLHPHAPLQIPVKPTDQRALGLHTHTPTEPRVPRRLLLILALRDPAWLSNFLSQHTEPWEVHIWQAASASHKSTDKQPVSASHKITDKQASGASVDLANASQDKTTHDPGQLSARIAAEESAAGSDHTVNVNAVQQADAMCGKAAATQIFLHQRAAGML